MLSALRSILRHPHPLLSPLRPARRHVSQLTPVSGPGSTNNNLVSSRRYGSTSNGDLHPEVKRHLYVVLDDHEDGYSIRKMDLACDHHDDLDGDGARRLLEPPFVRVELATVGERAQFAGVGSSIVAIGTPHRAWQWFDNHLDVGYVLLYDTETAALVVTPHLPKGLVRDGHKAAMPVGNRLYMLESATEPAWRSYRWNGGGNVHCLTPDSGSDDHGWPYWKPLSFYSRRWCWSYDDKKALTLPFCADYITAYAAHAPARQEHEIVVSVRATYERDVEVLGAGTFSFSTASREWTRRGDWQMPVHGYVHYDGELDAWLGLHAVNGHIGSGPTEWKVGREMLFRRDQDIAAGWRHLDSKVVPMAPREGGREYCIMERLVLPEGDKEDEERSGYKKKWLAEEKECMLRLTAFRVERGHDGEPVTTNRRPARSYRVSRYNRHFDAQAFWM